MFNFLQTPVLIHLHQGQGKVLTEVFMREAGSENTLQERDVCASQREQTKQRREEGDGREEESFQVAEITYRHALDLRNTALQVLPNGIDHYKNTSFIPGKQQHSRHAVKYNDSDVEVNIAREKHIIIILRGGFKLAAILLGYFLPQNDELKEKRGVLLYITDTIVSVTQLILDITYVIEGI